MTAVFRALLSKLDVRARIELAVDVVMLAVLVAAMIGGPSAIVRGIAAVAAGLLVIALVVRSRRLLGRP